MATPVRVLLVDDSPMALGILPKLLTSVEIAVVGRACSSTKALKLVSTVQPTVICLNLKAADGLELTKQVMAKYPRPILVISDGEQNTAKFLQAGALDVFCKLTTDRGADYEQIKQQLITKIKILAGVKVFTKVQKHSVSSPAKVFTSSTLQCLIPKANASAIKAIAIGSSTGGPRALREILHQLPAQYPAVIICTQHISIGFLQGLVNWLESECRLHVKVAQEKELPVPGTVYFAPENYHLELDSQGRFVYAAYEPVDGHCPSVTVTFRAVAQYYGKTAVGVLLTGMGKDGAAGMQAIAAAGGTTIAQDEASCVVFGMPKEAIALGAARHVLPLDAIAPWLLQGANGRERA